MEYLQILQTGNHLRVEHDPLVDVLAEIPRKVIDPERERTEISRGPREAGPRDVLFRGVHRLRVRELRRPRLTRNLSVVYVIVRRVESEGKRSDYRMAFGLPGCGIPRGEGVPPTV